MDFNKIAKEVLEMEANCLLDSARILESSAKNGAESSDFNAIVELIFNMKNKLVILGVGKSGLIGAKIAATLSSTGTPSIFMHPTEAMHGDLGAICKDDVILAISYSGESDELVRIMPHLKRLSHKIITMSKDKKSSLSALGDYFIDISVVREACPLNVAPTSSTTLTLALGDALAVCLMKRRGFQKSDFASFHPGGSLGRRLFVKIGDLAQKENLPIINKNTILKDAIITMSAAKLGCVLIVENEKLLAILSDGDLRRAMMRDDFSLNQCALMYATKNPKTCDDENTLAYDILSEIERLKIQALPITDKSGCIRGIIHIHKLIEAGIK